MQQHADGFDHYNTASQNYDLVVGTVTIGTAYRRFAPPSGCPGQGVLFSSHGAYIQKNLQSSQATLIIKAAVYFASLGNSGSGGNPFLCGVSTGVQWSLSVFSTGAVGIGPGNGGTIAAQTGPGVVTTNRWYGLEAEVVVGGSGAGSCSIWLNGTEILTATGIDTSGSSGSTCSAVALGDINDNGLNGMQADDFRIWDNTGSTQNAPLGASLEDSRLITKLPSAAGAYTQFTPNGASANWQCVDDNPPDGDTSYVSGSTAGLQDAYDMPTAGFTAAPAAVTAVAMARKDDGATREIAIGVDSGGHVAVGATATLGSTYGFVQSCIPDDPNTSAAWTAAAADGAEFYVEEIA